MDFRSHEVAQGRNDYQRLVDIAIKNKIRIRVTYKNLSGQESERELDPVEWVENHKFKAYCHLSQEDRHFVISGIKKLEYIRDASSKFNITQEENYQDSKPLTSKLDQWRVSQPTSTEKADSTAPRPSILKTGETFNQVSSSDEWRRLLGYYSECLNREFLQDYIIDQEHHANYQFFHADENSIWQFLAGNSLFIFPATIDGHPVDVTQFITKSEKREQQLCVGFPSLLSPDGKIAPLFFTTCEVEQKDDKVYLRPDEYELSYAILHSLDLDKEEFTAIVEELNQFEFDDLASKAKSLQTALVEKLGELIGYPVSRREANQSKLSERANELMLFTTPCLFWASKNNITHTLIEELEEIGKRPWEAIPQSLIHLLNSPPSGSYPNIVPFGRDNQVYATRINDEQRRAVKATSELPMTVVTGPPGTGKSQLVINIIANAVMSGKSVLFASRNNRAVDVVVDRMKNEMRFAGIVRTGNRSVRKDAANAMLDALSRAARARSTTDTALLQDTYLKNKNALANHLDTLHEIQRLKASRAKKVHEFEAICQGLIPELADSLVHRRLGITVDELVIAKKSASSLIETLKNVQKRKDTIESILQKHIADNQHSHPLIADLEAFELEWGAFGDGLRNADYFATLEKLLYHIRLWLSLLDAVKIELAIKKTSSDVSELQRRLDTLINELPAELQLSVEDIALKAPKEHLKKLNAQIQYIDTRITQAQRPSFSNWFGLRRGPQIAAIADSFNLLLSELAQPAIQKRFGLDEINNQFRIIENYVSAILTTRSLKTKEERLQQARNKLRAVLSIFSEQTRDQFKRLKLQQNESTDLRKLLGKLLDESEKAVQQRQADTKSFRDSIGNNKSLSEVWSAFQSAVGGDDYTEWDFDSEIGLGVLEHFASQWSTMLTAVELKVEIEQLTDIIQKKGDEEGINNLVESIQKKVTTQAVEILNNTWFQNLNEMRSERVQRVRDYASLIKEIAENYDGQKYANMMSIQETYTDDIIAVFPVWATTNLSISRNLPLRAELFDMVIIDEASQCDIPSALPLIYRSKEVIVIGDAMQLRHIATLTEDSHQILAADHNVATEAYSYTQHSLFDLASRSVGQHPGILMLKEHYRSHEHIIRFSNQTFYDGNLIIKTDMRNREIPDPILQSGCGIFWLNVSGETVHPSGGSAKNVREVDMIRHILPLLYQSITSQGWDASIGVVTPYKEQRNTIQAWVENQFGQQITVGTAHTFQGDEREILLFSPVLASGISDGSLSWLRRTKNLLNVAITRARTTLIIIGDFNFCMSLSEDNPYRQLAEYVRVQPGAVCQSWQEMPFSQL